MSMSPGYVSDRDILRVAGQRAVWTWSELERAIRVAKRCSTSTAQRAIRRATRAGILTRHGAWYQLTENADRLFAAPYCYRRVDRRAFLSIMAEREAWQYTDLMDEVCVRLDTTETSIMRSFRYGRQFGYIERTADRRWALTPLCRQQLALWGRLEGAEGFRFATYLSGHPKRGFKRWSDADPHPPPGERFPTAAARLLWKDGA
jgi:hypothetical protein